MHKARPTSILLAAAFVLLLGACGASSHGGPGAGGHMSGHSGGGATGSGRELTDVPSGAPTFEIVSKEFSFAPATIKTAAGPTTFTLENKGTIIHDLTVDGIGVHLAAEAGKSQTASYNLPEGTYEYYCTIPGHKAAGMKGTLNVT